MNFIWNTGVAKDKEITSKIILLNSDITKINVDAIVNAANKTLLGGGGVDGAIHKAAGKELFEECETLNGCNTGEAKITKGYNLPSKFVIHTVGPIWHGGMNNERKLLEDCYVNTLNIAKKNKIKTIAFPSISTGAYNFPKEKAANIAIKVVRNFIKNNSIDKVIFCVFDDENYSIYNKLLSEYQTC